MPFIKEKMTVRQLLRFGYTAFNAARIDVINRAKYGKLAPLYGERIWIDVSPDIISIGKAPLLRGKVLTEWPPFPISHKKKIVEIEPIRSCIDHWENGVRWEDTRVFEIMEKALHNGGKKDGCRTMEDVYLRYKALDKTFSTVNKQKRLLTQSELSMFAFREHGGINFHVGPEGEPFFGQIGQHRLAMALVVGIKRIPAELGAIYVGSLPFLKKFRNKNWK